jgi:glycogen synthase
VSLKVVHVAAEAAPYSKVGGLADVAGSLPLALAALGVECRLVTPRYRGTDIRDARDGVTGRLGATRSTCTAARSGPSRST